jgi:hypothetical protein
MFIYNVTIKLKESIHTDWLIWLKEEHIPDVLNTGCFSTVQVLRLLEIDDSEGPTYAIQYKTENNSNYQLYLDNYASALREKSYVKWGDQFIAFRSFMEVVN